MVTRLNQQATSNTMARSCSPKNRTPLLPPVKELGFLPAPPSSTGVRNVPLSYQNQVLSVTINDAHSPFEPSSLTEGSTRLTLTLRLPKEWDA